MASSSSTKFCWRTQERWRWEPVRASFGSAVVSVHVVGADLYDGGSTSRVVSVTAFLQAYVVRAAGLSSPQAEACDPERAAPGPGGAENIAEGSDMPGDLVQRLH